MEEPNKHDEKLKLIREKSCKGASDLDFDVFMHVVKKTGLDPLMNQIYAVGRNSMINGKWVMTYTTQTSIDGLRILAEKTGKYAPGKAPEYAYTENGRLLFALSTVKKQTLDGTWHEISNQAYWDEFVQKTKSGEPTRFWKQMGHLMLAKCAEALALRKAFPAELSGIYIKDEMDQAEVMEVEKEEELTASEVKQIAFLLKKLSPARQTELLKCFQISSPYDLPKDKFDILSKILKKEIKEILNGTSKEKEEGR